jgi:hypothetical protein
MKKPHLVLFSLLLALVTFGCQPEGVSPAGSTKTIAGTYIPIPRPDAPCGPSAFSQMKDGAANFGTVEILNTATDIYLILDLNPLKFVEEIKVFSGNVSSLAMNLDGSINVNAFNNQPSITTPLNDYTMMLPLPSRCTDILIWARITTRSPMGSLIATNYAWMMGTNVANGYKVNYCPAQCAVSDPKVENMN